MLDKNFYIHIGKSPKIFLLFIIMTVLFFSGVTFTFVIPGLKGFIIFFMMIAILIYFFVANIFVGIYQGKMWLVFLVSLIVSSLGMGLRIWIEWGEYSLVEFSNPTVYIGYPFTIATFITVIYCISNFIFRKNISMN